MSYILDALKHSDRDRDRGKVPNIQTQTLQLVETSSGKPIPYMWAGVVFLGLVIVLVAGNALLDEGETGQQISARSPDMEPTLVAPDSPDKTLQLTLPIKVTDPPLRNDEWLLSAETLDGVEDVRINTTQARANDFSVASTRFADNLKQQAIVELPKTTAPQPKPVAKQSVVSVPASVTFNAPESAEKPEDPPIPDPYAGIPHQKQLPAQVQRALPELNFTVHIYSTTPASRMVKINGMRLREGDQLSNGLKLKEITKDGVILSYNNRPFWRTAR